MNSVFINRHLNNSPYAEMFILVAFGDKTKNRVR
jgi:hypothetical protein